MNAADGFRFGIGFMASILTMVGAVMLALLVISVFINRD